MFGVAIGGVADRFDELRVMFVGLALLALGSLLGGLIADSGVLLATRVIEGLGYTAVAVTAPKIIAVAARPADMVIAIGIWSTFMPLGMALIMVLSPLMLDGIGWQGVWLVNAAVIAVFAGVLAVGMRKERSGGARDGRAAQSAAAPVFDWAGVRILMARPGPWLLGLCFALYTIQWFAIMAWLPTFLVETQGRSLTTASLFAALVVFANISGNLGAGWLLHLGVARWLLIAVAFFRRGRDWRADIFRRHRRRGEYTARGRLQRLYRPVALGLHRRRRHARADAGAKRHVQRLRHPRLDHRQPARPASARRAGRELRQLGEFLVGHAHRPSHRSICDGGVKGRRAAVDGGKMRWAASWHQSHERTNLKCV